MLFLREQDRRRDESARCSGRGTGARVTSAPSRRMGDSNWREIASLYGVLERMTGNPMVPLNRAIAVRDGRPPVGRSRTSGAAVRAAGRPPPPTCGARHLLECLTGSTPRSLTTRREPGRRPADEAEDQTARSARESRGTTLRAKCSIPPALNRRRRAPDPVHQPPREQPGKAPASPRRPGHHAALRRPDRGRYRRLLQGRDRAARPRGWRRC
jgi:hypothetical protein